jgi:hypothetical protein
MNLVSSAKTGEKLPSHSVRVIVIGLHVTFSQDEWSSRIRGNLSGVLWVANILRDYFVLLSAVCGILKSGSQQT